MGMPSFFDMSFAKRLFAKMFIDMPEQAAAGKGTRAYTPKSSQSIRSSL